MSHLVRDVARRNAAGEAVGLVSVCSAHPLVLRAAAEEAVAQDAVLLVEATSNQVDQDGGYTGLRPADFRALVEAAAREAGLDAARVVLGGDHLGPNTWRGEGADAAMAKAEVLVAAFVEAGFTKVHLDCSMACAGDQEPLADEVVAARAARLARAAEDAAARAGTAGEQVYVIGTEVPVPGGAHETIDALVATTPDAARATLAAHRAAFAAAGVEDAFGRVVALVVQPGVEFDHARVVDYRPEAARELSRALDDAPGVAYEAHSTDYQEPAALAALVRDHWAVLKVGPGLTFALREALFALAAVEAELLPEGERSDLPAVVDAVMLAEPRWWRGYYEGDERARALARRYSYSDRLRYYWPAPEVQRATDRLLEGLGRTGVPLPLLSAHLPDQYTRVRAGQLAPDPVSLAVDRVRDVLRAYHRACTPPATTTDPRSAR